MKFNFILLLIFATSILGSCEVKTKFSVATTSSYFSAEFRKLEKIYNKYIEDNGKKFRLDLKLDTNFLMTTNYELLRDGKFDMALLTNDNLDLDDSGETKNSNIQTVLPINSRILYILYNKEMINPESIKDVCENHKVLILDAEEDFIKELLEDLGVELDKVHFIKNTQNNKSTMTNLANREKMRKRRAEARRNGDTTTSSTSFWRMFRTEKDLPYDVEIGFSSLDFDDRNRINRFVNTRRDFELFSLDDSDLYLNGSKAEGFCLRNKYFTPYLLPKGAFGEYPKKPIITIRQDYILAAASNVDEEFIYNFVKNAIDGTDLIDLSIYGKNFENMSLAYPLHSGTVRFLDKNAPTFLEKYGELIGKLGAGVGGFYTGLMGLLFWRKSRRRKHIVNDFQRVLNIQNQINASKDVHKLEGWYLELQTIENKYHYMMLERKVIIDESLQIFFDLIDKNQAIILDNIKSQGGSLAKLLE
ncbi:MAG: hypothetical protein A2X64_00350 [Ignavibacteria bacterium GWF2_33_9]|nr:MAG: hypothetical protein A2X64_00350 [Ignavibacteria bacterium GWF2_33_9]